MSELTFVKKYGIVVALTAGATALCGFEFKQYMDARDENIAQTEVISEQRDSISRELDSIFRDPAVSDEEYFRKAGALNAKLQTLQDDYGQTRDEVLADNGTMLTWGKVGSVPVGLLGGELCFGLLGGVQLHRTRRNSLASPTEVPIHGAYILPHELIGEPIDPAYSDFYL